VVEAHWGRGSANVSASVVVGGVCVLDSTGHLPRVSPGEQVYAFIHAVYRDYRAAASEDVMTAWRDFALSVPFFFRTIDSDDEAHKLMLQLRQDIKADRVGMAHTLLQTICDVVAFRDRKPKWSIDKLAEEYSSIKWVEEDDGDESPKSAHFVRSALKIQNQILAVPRLKEIVVEAQEWDRRNIFDKLSKLLSICRAAPDPDDMAWVMGMMMVPHLAYSLHCRDYFYTTITTTTTTTTAEFDLYSCESTCARPDFNLESTSGWCCPLVVWPCNQRHHYRRHHYHRHHA